VPAGANEAEVEAARQELESRMNAMTAGLERAMGNELDPLLEQPDS
jgi:hypothetical protein